MSIEYFAGFFDGEGCITLGKNGGLTISLINTSYPVLCRFQDYFGGSLKERKQKVNKTQYDWRLYGEEAEMFLEEISDHLIDKQVQAYTALGYLIDKVQFKPLRKETKGAFANPERQLLIDSYRDILTKQKLGTYIDD